MGTGTSIYPSLGRDGNGTKTWYSLDLGVGRVVKTSNPTQPTTSWPLSDLTQPGSLISESKKIQTRPNPP